MTLVWKKVKEFPWYEVSNTGNVRNRFGHILKTRRIKGFDVVQMKDVYGRTRTRSLSKIVRETFPETKEKPNAIQG